MDKDNKKVELDNIDKKFDINGYDYGLDIEEHLRRYLQEQMGKSLDKPLGVDAIEEIMKRLRGEIK